MLNGYTPVFSTYDGGVYEMELTRSAIHSFATHASKLLPEVNGSAYKELANTLKFKPNPFMSTSQFLYRVATILSVNNTCYIVPIEDDYGYITGYYPLIPTYTEVLEVDGEPFLRYTFSNGKKACIEFSKVGMLTNFQYKNDFAGETNTALNSTLSLLETQKQGIEEGIKSSAFVRFIGKLTSGLFSEDITAERNRFKESNLGTDNNGGIILVGSNYADIKQVDSKPFIVDADQSKLIQENVYNYFGVNTAILQNCYKEEEWGAFYVTAK